jgi:hypothetical protein
MYFIIINSYFKIKRSSIQKNNSKMEMGSRSQSLPAISTANVNISNKKLSLHSVGDKPVLENFRNNSIKILNDTATTTNDDEASVTSTFQDKQAQK